MKYWDIKTRQSIVKDFQRNHNNNEPIDIGIVTYNRLEYLKKCFWSLIASTVVPYRLFIIDDHSTDGTAEWLSEIHKRGLTFQIVLNKQNIGSAANFNYLASITTSEWFVMIQDDIWLGNYWDLSSINIINNFDDCGFVSFYRFTRLGDEEFKNVNEYSISGQKTGMSATVMYRGLYNVLEKFRLPKDHKMGYYSTDFCKRAMKLKEFKRNKSYFTNPQFALMMDMTHSKLNEREYSEKTGYIKHRQKHKISVGGV